MCSSKNFKMRAQRCCISSMMCYRVLFSSHHMQWNKPLLHFSKCKYPERYWGTVSSALEAWRQTEYRKGMFQHTMDFKDIVLVSCFLSALLLCPRFWSCQWFPMALSLLKNTFLLSLHSVGLKTAHQSDWRRNFRLSEIKKPSHCNFSLTNKGFFLFFCSFFSTRLLLINFYLDCVLNLFNVFEIIAFFWYPRTA